MNGQERVGVRYGAWLRRGLMLLVVGVLGLLPACAEEGEKAGARCDSDDECEKDTCISGYCFGACSGNSDCADEAECLEGFCYVPCDVDADCPGSESCLHALLEDPRGYCTQL